MPRRLPNAKSCVFDDRPDLRTGFEPDRTLGRTDPARDLRFVSHSNRHPSDCPELTADHTSIERIKSRDGPTTIPVILCLQGSTPMRQLSYPHWINVGFKLVTTQQ